MANDGVVFLLVLLQEILGTGEGHLVDVALHLIGRHANAVVADGDGLGLTIHRDQDGSVIPFAAVAGHGGHAALADGVDAIAHKLPKKHLVAGINGLLDDRENVFGVDLNLTLFLQHRHSFAAKNQTLETGFTRAQRLFQGVPRTFYRRPLVQLRASSAGRGALQRRWPPQRDTPAGRYRNRCRCRN